MKLNDQCFYSDQLKPQDPHLDADGSKQVDLHRKVVNMLTGEIATKTLSVGELQNIARSRDPPSDEFQFFWEDLLATAEKSVKAGFACDIYNMYVLLFIYSLMISNCAACLNMLNFLLTGIVRYVCGFQ